MQHRDREIELLLARRRARDLEAHLAQLGRISSRVDMPSMSLVSLRA